MPITDSRHVSPHIASPVLLHRGKSMKRHASLNRIYRLVWSHVLNSWIAVAETARGRGKSMASRKLIAIALALGASMAQAAPGGGQVVSGSGAITQSGNTTTINQASQNLSLDWKTFNVATQETVNFNQPSASALAVNRIHDTNGSVILGHLNANGQIYLINPNGILFGKGAQVNVGGLVASTLDTADNSTFAGSGTGSIVNEGTINAAHYVALLGNSVTNSGLITAQLGTVALGAGNQVSLSFSGNDLVKLQVDKSVLDSLVANHGLIQADGGMVVMNAGARDSLLVSAVNNDGIIEARSVQNQNGSIVLLAGMAAGTTRVDGTLDAGAPGGGNGGFIETSATHVNVADSARVTTLAANGNSGTWLIDPTDFTIAATGGDMTGAAVNTALAGGNFSILSSSGATAGSGDINVNDALTWSANTLTLNAYRNIVVNSAMNATGTAGLVLQYGMGAVASGNTSYDYIHAPINMASTATFQTQQGSDGTLHSYTIINSLGAAGSTTTTDLQGMNGNLTGYYALGSDIAIANTSSWNGGTGFAPIGANGTNQFTGGFDGLGHTIGSTSALTINSSTSYLGLFGYVVGARIKNVAVNVNIGGADATFVGGLVGFNSGTIVNSSTSGTVYGRGDVGGLAGSNVNGGPYGIQHSFSSAHVGSVVTDTPTSGNANYDKNFGGLVGHNSGTINQSYATGSVFAAANPVPVINTITPNNAGGLAGENATGGSITDSYSTGAVQADGANIGGLIGLNSSTVSNSYTTGRASGGGSTSSNIGGFIGSYTTGTITSSYWDTANSSSVAGTFGAGNSSGATGRSASQMQQQSSFTSWDFTNTWAIYSGHTAPLLRTFMKPLTITASNISQTYSGSAYGGGLSGATYSVAGADTSGNLFNVATPYAGDVQANWVYTPDIWSNQKGYIISYAGGSLTINPRVISLTGSRVYDGTSSLAATIFTLSNLAPGETLRLSGTGTMANKNVGTAKSVAKGSLTLNTITTAGGGWATNYTLTGGTYTADITPKALTVSATGISKIYDGLRTATATLADDRIAGDVLTLASTSAIFANKNVANGKAVNVSGITVTGTDAGNYTFNTSALTTANITPKALTVSATGVNKIYDGQTTATATLSDDRIAGDVLTLASTAASFANKNVANGKAVNVSGITVTGTDAGNYTFNTGASTTANITPKAVTLTAPSVSKTYDGGLSYTATAGDLSALAASLVGGDTVTAATLAYTDKNTGTGNKTVNLNAATISDGNGGGNYSVTFANNATSSIVMAPLTVSANSARKIYDGLAYSGGNGVTYIGLANGETSSVLGGTLAYGGSAQGAVDAGSYAITPGGYTSTNYTISYADGALTIWNAMPSSVDEVADTYAQSLLNQPPVVHNSQLRVEHSQPPSGNADTTDTPVFVPHPQGHGFSEGVLTILGSGILLPEDMLVM
ncbi:MAG: filamentous hemagglutinin N-terminal domain-containing protein [Sideroxydans sp.]|nr:filamentous hemagglutinin N-terminal domain-containing protein [Sideroxydans sp.]